MQTRGLELFQAIRSHREQQTAEDQTWAKQLADKYGFSHIQASHLLEVARHNPQILSAEIENLLKRISR